MALARESLPKEKSMNPLLLFLLCAMTPSSDTVYAPNGEVLRTYQTPSGAVTYDSQGRKIERYDKPDDGSVWYDERGEKWESYPDLQSLPREQQ